jgi:hypothetical protein
MSSNATPSVEGPVTVSVVPGVATLDGVATVVGDALPTYFHPLLQSRPPYTVTPSALGPTDSVSLYDPMHTYTRFVAPEAAAAIPAPTDVYGLAIVPLPAPLPVPGATKMPVPGVLTTHGSTDGSSALLRQSSLQRW